MNRALPRRHTKGLATKTRRMANFPRCAAALHYPKGTTLETMGLNISRSRELVVVAVPEGLLVLLNPRRGVRRRVGWGKGNEFLSCQLIFLPGATAIIWRVKKFYSSGDTEMLTHHRGDKPSIRKRLPFPVGDLFLLSDEEGGMIVKVVMGAYSRGEAGEDGWRPSQEVLVNADSPIRLICCYIQQTFQIDCDLEWDLCDECGNLVYVHEKEPWTRGMNYLVPKSTYMVVLFERDLENRLANPMLYLHESLKRSSNLWSELMTKIRKQINPVLAGKASRRSRSRLNTSNVK